MSRRRSIMAGGLFALGTRLAYAVAQLVYLAVMARLLAPADFGLFAIGTSITVLATMLTDFGFSTAVFQTARLDSRQASALFWMNLALALVLALALALGRGAIAALFREEALRHVVLVLAVALPFSAIAAMYKALLSRRRQWKAVYPGFLACQLVALVLSVAFALWVRRDYTALLVTPLVTAIGSMLLFSRAAGWLPRRRFSVRRSLGLLGHGSALSATGIANYLNRQSDNVLIGWRWTAADLGFYSRAYSLFQLPSNNLVTPLQPVILSALARRRDAPVQWEATWQRAAMALLLATGALGVGVFRYSDMLVALVYGPGWEPAMPILGVLALSIPAATVGQVLTWAMISRQGSAALLAYALSTALVRFAGFAVAVQFGPFYVAATWTATSWLFAGVLSVLTVRRGTISRDTVVATLVPVVGVVALAAAVAALMRHATPAHLIPGLADLAEACGYLIFFILFAVWNPVLREVLTGLSRRLRRRSV